MNMSEPQLTELSQEIEKSVAKAIEKKERERLERKKKFFSYQNWAESYKDSTEQQREKLWKLFEQKEREKAKMVINPDYSTSEQLEIFGQEESLREKKRRKEGIIGSEQTIIEKQKKRKEQT